MRIFALTTITHVSHISLLDPHSYMWMPESLLSTLLKKWFVGAGEKAFLGTDGVTALAFRR